MSESIETSSESVYFAEARRPVAGLGQQRLRLTGYGPTLTRTRFTFKKFAGVRGKKTHLRRIWTWGIFQQKHSRQASTLDSRAGSDGSARQTAQRERHGILRVRRTVNGLQESAC